MQPGGQFVKPLSVADYEQDPYNEFLTQQGGKAIERSASASGLRGSGNVLASLSDYGQKMAGAGFADWYNRETAKNDSDYNKLAGLSGTGMIAGTQMGSTDINNNQFQSGQTFQERMQKMQNDAQIRAAREANKSNPLMDILGAGAMGVGIYSGLRK